MKVVKLFSIGLACGLVLGLTLPSGFICEADDTIGSAATGVYEGFVDDEDDSGGTRTGGYDNCDVNHSGSVNIVDAICVNQYLSGALYFPNYRLFDANNSSTVDYTDFECVMAKVVDQSYSAQYMRRVYNGNAISITYETFPAVTSSDTTYCKDVDAYSTSPRGYTWQKYKQNTANTASVPDTNYDPATYSITPSNTGLNAINGDSPRAIIGDDDMKPAYGSAYKEVSGIVDINGATGFIVGDHEIATAAHVVLTGSDFDDLTVHTCNSSGLIQSTVLHVKQVHVPTAAIPDGLAKVSDYALIVVSETLSTNNGYTHFSIGSTFNATDSTWSSVPIYVTGKPSNIFHTAVGSVYGSSNTALLHYNTDTDYGSSGSPVYTITRYTVDNVNYYSYTALAVHSSRDTNDPHVYNYGPLLTRYHRLFYLNNPQENYN